MRAISVAFARSCKVVSVHNISLRGVGVEGQSDASLMAVLCQSHRSPIAASSQNPPIIKLIVNKPQSQNMPSSRAHPPPVEASPERRRQRLAPEARADQILDVAAKLILAEGLTEVSMERLGRDAGISKALIYNYFPNRNELLRALLEREIAALRGRQVAEVKAASDFGELVRRTTRIYVEHVNERGALLQRLWAEPAVSRTVAEEDTRSRDAAMRYFARQVTKEYGLPMDVALSAVDMQMAMTEAAAQHLSNSHNDVDFATDICVTLLLGGLDALAKRHQRNIKNGSVDKPARSVVKAAVRKTPVLKASLPKASIRKTPGRKTSA